VAHVQRLAAKLTDIETRQNAMEIEQGLKRLTRLIERMLQMSRTQSGLGISAEQADIAPVINLLLRELRDRVPSSDLLVIKPPQGIWMSNVDPDAAGIILNNLFENAIRHASGDQPLMVDASQLGRIIITNDCAPLSSTDLEVIKQRHNRNSATSTGFGLGLSIVRDLCDQSGSTLELASPPAGQLRGFASTVTFMIAET
jgi:two-component system OmpR family sensor kinase